MVVALRERRGLYYVFERREQGARNVTMKRPRVNERSSDEAVKAKTGKVWTEWFKILDKAGAKKMPHTEITTILHDRGVGSWWGQMVAVEYERERGIREKYQKCTGEFSTSGSRTIVAPMAKAFADRKSVV